ncbi:unnamed protein product, partial [Owenia fusiformis]
MGQYEKTNIMKLIVLITYLSIAHCQWLESEVTGYYKRKGDAPGSDMLSLYHNTVVSLQQCADICTPVETCRGFFYDFARSKCWSKSSERYPVIPYWNNDQGFTYTKGERLVNCNTTLLENDHLIKITTSTVNDDNHYTYGPYNSYIDSNTELSPYPKAGCWKAGVVDENQWWQVEFSEPKIVQAVVTQGCDQRSDWFVNYTVLFSDDGVQFSVVGISDTKAFVANSNSDVKVVNLLPETLTKFVRIRPRASVGGEPGMRVEI